MLCFFNLDDVQIKLDSTVDVDLLICVQRLQDNCLPLLYSH